MIYFVSLKFAPAHVIHMTAYAKCMKEYSITYYLSKEYKMFENELEKLGIVTYSNENIDMGQNIYFFFSPSERNCHLAKKIKRNNGKIIYLYHEPWRGYVTYFKEMKGIKNKLKVFALHYFQSKMVNLTDKLILPSQAAMNLCYKYENNKNLNKIVNIPLLFNDDFVEQKKIYFSYIGTVAYQHAFDEFIGYMMQYYKNVPYNFLIATRSELSEKTLKLIKPLIDEKRLYIQKGRNLTNEEMNYFYSCSFLCWNAYRHSTQSGVLPNAYMNSTPVLATHIGSFDEFVVEGKTGEFVEYNYLDIYNKSMKIYKNINVYTKESRKYFLNNFYYKSNQKTVLNVVKEVGDD